MSRNRLRVGSDAERAVVVHELNNRSSCTAFVQAGAVFDFDAMARSRVFPRIGSVYGFRSWVKRDVVALAIGAGNAGKVLTNNFDGHDMSLVWCVSRIAN